MIGSRLAGSSLCLALAAFGAGLAATIFSNVAGFVMQIHYATMTDRQMWNKELELGGRMPTHHTQSCLLAGDRRTANPRNSWLAASERPLPPLRTLAA